MNTPTLSAAPRIFLASYIKTFLLGTLAVACIAVPYSAWWIYKSGDVAVERIVALQKTGKFALFGSGVSQDFVDYKLRLYEAMKPRITTIGSSRVMQFRGKYFGPSYMNMGGVAGNIQILRSTLDTMLRIHRPEAVIMGLDFWWFMPRWEPAPFQRVPPTSGSYTYGADTLKKPWEWLLKGKISLPELFAPLTGRNRPDRFGIMAQQTDDGFGSDGSWYYTADATGRKKPYDYQFRETLGEVDQGIKAFYWSKPGPDTPGRDHVLAIAEIVTNLESQGIQTYLFIPPLSGKVLAEMRMKKNAYTHLFGLKAALEARGLRVLDATEGAAYGSGDCEFVDGFHGGEVTYVRVLRELVRLHPELASYVNEGAMEGTIRDWSGFCIVPNPELTALPEVDFMHFGCPKRKASGQ